MKKTAVIILNWNGRKLLEQFLPTVLKHTSARGFEVVVADNGSGDDSVAWMQQTHPSIRLLTFDRNAGFAEGYNKAIAEVESDYVVLLNSDIETTAGWLTTLYDYMEANPDVVACQPKILSYRQRDTFEYAGAAGGYIDYLGYPFCRGRVQTFIEKDEHQYDTVADVFWATGACMMIRRNEYLNAGGLDPGFFAHMEEIDLCWRLRSRGMRIVCVPQSVVYHVGGATLETSNPMKTFLNFRNNLLMLYKNLPKNKYRSIISRRILLDVAAAMMFLVKGNLGSCNAVFKAHRSYRRMKPDYKSVREAIQEAAVSHDIPEIYQGNSVADFYLKGKKTFDKFF